MKKLLKPILSLILLCGVFSLAGCKEKNKENDKENTQIVAPNNNGGRPIKPSEDLGEGNSDQQRIGEQ